MAQDQKRTDAPQPSGHETAAETGEEAKRQEGDRQDDARHRTTREEMDEAIFREAGNMPERNERP
ncbi:hypothetical protein [Sabulicella glaciei]|uniref:Uncharacterized protein n=1 Tax=Sabulicella glaciei TaxID=2984948 RepID=A0ABT3NTX6_9PROT|nr:hypothetical protein [Roseococcus sp. MDT2-1-1]MCW8085620.1 hypothetical protein [Roseococcus sp. MDT2-1-1]